MTKELTVDTTRPKRQTDRRQSIAWHLPRRGLAALLAGLAILTTPSPAMALDFIRSSAAPDREVIRWGVGGELPLPASLALNAQVRFLPNLADVIGDRGSFSSLIDGEALLLYKYEFDTPLADIGLRPIVAPYVGARYLGVPMVQAGSAFGAGYNQIAGPSYGVRGILGLPLDLQALAYLGASSFVWGRWGATALGGASEGGNLDTGGATVPTAGVQLSWSPLGIFTVYVGAETSQLPIGLTGTSGQLGGERTTLTALRAGLSFLFISI